MGSLKAFLVKKIRLKHSTIERPTQVLHFLCFLGFVIGFTFVFAIFSVYKKIMELIMILRLGKNFHGFVPNSDAIFTVEQKEWRTNIIGLAFFRSKEKIDVLQRVRDRFKERVFDDPENYRKLTSTYHRFMGYIYFVYDTYTLDDSVVPIKSYSEMETMSDHELKRFIQANGNTPLPKNGSGLWQLFVGQKPMEETSGNEDGTYTYPIIFKVHHILGDGTSLFTSFTKIYADDPECCKKLLLDKINTISQKRANASKKSPLEYLTSLAKKILHMGYILYSTPGSLLFLFYLRTHDQNALHGPDLSGDKVMGWVREHRVELIPMAKKIKNTVPNTTFSDVIYTAVTASFIDYFKRNSCEVPDHLSISLSLLMSLRSLGKSGSDSMENNLGIATLEVPCDAEGSLLDTLDKVREQYAFVKTIPDTEAGYLFLDALIGPFPLTLLSNHAVLNIATTYITNIPGGPIIKMLDGCEVDALIPLLPNRGKIGISIGVVSYDDRLTFGVYGDRALIDSVEIQKFADGILENLRLLDREVEAKYKY